MVYATWIGGLSPDSRSTSPQRIGIGVTEDRPGGNNRGCYPCLNRIAGAGIYSIENPSPGTLTKFFGEYSLAAKAYQTHGNDDALFREVARVLHEYGFVHPRQCLRTELGSSSQHTKG